MLLLICVNSGFKYDCSVSEAPGSSSPFSRTQKQKIFPYTLDNGLLGAQSCFTGICDNRSIPAFWEMPLYAFMSADGLQSIASMARILILNRHCLSTHTHSFLFFFYNFPGPHQFVLYRNMLSNFGQQLQRALYWQQSALWHWAPPSFFNGRSHSCG